MKKKASLRRTYYGAFFLLTVLPLLVAACVGLGYFYRMQLSDARETIELQQKSVSDTLRQEVQQASLQLSHFLLSPEGDALSLVQQLPQSAGERYEIQSALDDTFGYYRLTGHRLAALHLYLKDGTAYELYTALAVPRQNVEEMDWYRKALQQPERVVVGAAAPDTLIHATNRPGKVLLTAAISMGDEGGALEEACLYFETEAEALMQGYDTQNPATRMFLLLDGQVLAGDEAYRDAAVAFWNDPNGAYDGMDWCITTPVASTGLCVLTLVDNQRLLAGVYQAGALLLVVFAVIFALYLAFSILFLKRILDPLNSLYDGMKRLQAGDFSHRLAPDGHRELRELMECYNDTGARMQTLTEENRRREEEKYQEELKALQSEINPHFLLNTINTICFMADIAKFDSIRDMAANLMSILDCVLRNRSRRYTLADEVRLLDAYIQIMEVRYGNSFAVNKEFTPDSLSCRLPKLLLQPLVENAIFHGLDGREDGVIQLTGRVEEGVLHICVRDNGAGMTDQQARACLAGPKKETGHSIGLWNVQRRLKLQYGEQYGLAVESGLEQGTCVRVTLPAQMDEKEEGHAASDDCGR